MRGMGCDDRVSGFGSGSTYPDNLVIICERAAGIVPLYRCFVPPSGYTDRTSDLVPPLIPSLPLGKFTTKIMLAEKPLQ